MTDTLSQIRALVQQGQVRVSEHGVEEILEDSIDLEVLLAGVETAVVVEDYPDAHKGPSVLVLQKHGGQALHVVWGLARLSPDIATLVTAYFPDPGKWYDGFLKRKPR